jgi:hypothetical protein
VAPAPDPLGGWVHLFEEDGADGAVYVPEDSDLPLSRRVRERIELRPDGSAAVILPGPDDRPVPTAARWERRGGSLEIRLEGSPRYLRVRQVAAARWLVDLGTD